MSTDRRPGAANAAPGRSGRARGSHAPREDGAATAEAAIVIPSILIVALLLVWAVTLGTAQLRCFDAARIGARAIARGESTEAARRVALDAAPDNATVSVSRSGDEINVVVQVARGAPGWFPNIGDVRVVGTATAAAEDSPWTGEGP